MLTEGGATAEAAAEEVEQPSEAVAPDGEADLSATPAEMTESEAASDEASPETTESLAAASEEISEPENAEVVAAS